MLLAEIYVLVCILFLAGKDASSYLLKEKDNPITDLERKRIQRWHRDGVALNALIIVPIVYLRPELSLIILYTILIRLSVFDLAFNKWAGLDYKFLGSTAWADKIFNKIFGDYGAVKKSIFFFIVLIILNVFLT
jgi:hypothetical protein